MNGIDWTAYRRYAIYHTPAGALGRFGATWLGWDVAAGVPVRQPDVADVAAATETPRRYGFHATMKAPFRLAEGHDAASLGPALRDVVAAQPTVRLPGGLRLDRIDSFLALIPAGESDALAELEARVVQALDGFRAPLTADETERRRPEQLSQRQRENLFRWGYPYVLEEFRFHMTLSGSLTQEAAARMESALQPRLQPLLADPYLLNSLSLVGEDAGGFFHELARVPLQG